MPKTDMAILFFVLVAVLMILSFIPAVRTFIEQPGTWTYPAIIMGLFWACLMPVVFNYGSVKSKTELGQTTQLPESTGTQLTETPDEL